jgi:hypothetical protein
MVDLILKNSHVDLTNNTWNQTHLTIIGIQPSNIPASDLNMAGRWEIIEPKWGG